MSVCAVYRACNGQEFQCTNERCVYEAFVCDGDDDCEDNSDELHCCESDTFFIVVIKSSMFQ